MTPDTVARVHRLLQWLESGKHRLTIDADVHVTDVEALTGDRRERYLASPDYYHGRPISAEEALAEMDLAGVDLALVWQNPAATAYAGDPVADYAALLAANRYIGDIAWRHPARFFPAGWTDPRALGLEGALGLVDELVGGFGFTIIKLNPAQDQYLIDSEPVCAVVDRIVASGAVPAFHFGADTPFTTAAGLERIASRHPDWPMIAVHMGGGGAAYPEADGLYLEARALGLRRPNLRFVLSAKRDTHIESDLITYRLAGAPFSRHLCFASDAPYGRMTWNFGGARAMLRSLADHERHPDARIRQHPGLFSPAAAQDYLGRNAAELIIDSCRRWLAVQAPARPAIAPAAIAAR